MTRSVNPAAFVRRNTAVAAPPLLPELHLHLAGEVTPLWQATEAVLAQQGVPPPFWAFAWVGGQALARFLLDRPDIVRGRGLLDIGAGSGLVAIAAAKAGAAPVVAAEIDPFAAAAIRLNAARNRVAVRVRRADAFAGAAASWPVVTAGDICYERAMAERAVPWLRRLAAAGSLVLLGDPGRAYLPATGLLALARYTVPTSREIEDSDSREATVWRVLAE